MTNQLSVELRQQCGTSAAKGIRREGKVPGVVYGANREPLSVSVNRQEALNALDEVYKGTQLLLVDISGKETVSAIIREVQTHYMDGTLQNLDIWVVNPKKEITVKVYLIPTGDWDLQRAKGFHMEIKSIKVTGLPENLPGTVPFSTTNLAEGEKLRIKDIALPEGISIAEHGNTVVCRQ
ncbi:50S ribosomal protein L25 [bacterium]|nr:50S ribosomal protein L25 [bacterium]